MLFKAQGFRQSFSEPFNSHLLGDGGRTRFALLCKEEALDVGEDTAGGDCACSSELAELLIVADGELDMTRHNGLLFVLSAGITGEVKDLLREVLHDSGG